MSLQVVVTELITTSLLALAFIYVVLAVRPILHRYANAQWAYFLWLVSLAPLVLTFLPLPALLPFDNYREANNVFERAVSGNFISTVWCYVVGMVWALGAAASLYRFWKQSTQLRITVNKSLGFPPSTVRGQYERICTKAGVHPPPSLCISTSLKTPILFGIVNPTMVIPESFAEDYSSVEQELVLYHELVHFRRRDAYWNLIFRICRALFWFAPFLATAERRFRADQERSCDFSVLRDESPPTRGHYASAILKTVSACSFGVTATAFRSNGSDLLGRTEALVHHKTSYPRSLVGVICVTALIVLAIQVVPRPIDDARSLYSTHSWCAAYSKLGL